MNHIQ